MKKHVFPLLLIGITILIWVIALPKLPAELPVHWNFNGEVDRYESKAGAMLSMVGMMVLIYGLFVVVPRIDPQKANYKYFTKGYGIIVNSVLALMAIVNILTVLAGLGYDIPIGTLGNYVLGAIFIIVGNFMQQVRTNYFIGIRTPWTLCSETVWKKTHRLAGKVFFLGGLLIILAAFLPTDWKPAVTLTVVIITAGLPLAYSYWLYKKEIGKM
ncbi:SdpI family protein [Brevibacillus massiliensis]|uniref:SdpI family protein n=1 Tax=Brevibacillus massiliensis TaxID=1118054 RepID=UPI000474D3A3|nr:SdpI family protein [Brevibacillus massiliensis]